MRIAIVTTAYKIDTDTTMRFILNNRYDDVFIVCDSPREYYGGVRWIQAPEMDIFSITRCSNIGVFCAINTGFDIVVKTDIDCIVTSDALAWISDNVRDGIGYAFRYWQVKRDAVTVDNAELMPRVMGTIAMTANDWTTCMGYNEAMRGYGYDDYDVTRRAANAGINVRTIKNPKIYHIEHPEKHNRTSCNPVLREENIAIARNHGTF